jgi:hypothetical protein
MDNTFRLRAGGVYAVEGVFGDGRADEVCRVGIKDVDDGIWIVSLMHYDLGYIDLEQKTLQPLDNPFEPKVLPMSPV